MLDYFQTGAFLGTSPARKTTLRGVLQDNFVRDIRTNDVVLEGRIRFNRY